jgi:hypothetical protein
MALAMSFSTWSRCSQRAINMNRDVTLNFPLADERPAEPATLVDRLSRRARHQPEQCACAFLLDDERLTCAALDRPARAIAAWLQALLEAESGGVGEGKPS